MFTTNKKILHEKLSKDLVETYPDLEISALGDLTGEDEKVVLIGDEINPGAPKFLRIKNGPNETETQAIIDNFNFSGAQEEIEGEKIDIRNFPKMDRAIWLTFYDILVELGYAESVSQLIERVKIKYRSLS